MRWDWHSLQPVRHSQRHGWDSQRAWESINQVHQEKNTPRQMFIMEKSPKGKMEWGCVRGLKKFLKQASKESFPPSPPLPTCDEYELGEGKGFLDLDVCMPS